MAGLSGADHLKVVRGWAWFDLVVTGLFVFAPTAHLFIAVLYTANGSLGGNSVPPAFTAIHWMFVSLAGVLGVLWALARIVQPSVFLGAADAIGRSVVAVLLLFYVFAAGAPVALLPFVATEIVGAIHQGWILGRVASPAHSGAEIRA